MVFKIFVKSKHFKEPINLIISDDTTGKDLKRIIRNMTGIAMNRQRLTILGFPLDDAKSINMQDYIVNPPYSISLDLINKNGKVLGLRSAKKSSNRPVHKRVIEYSDKIKDYQFDDL